MDKDKWIIFSTPNGDNGGNSFLYQYFMKAFEKEQVFVGIDWAKDSGMSRGDVIEREGNVLHIRFKTVGIECEK